MKVNVCLSSDDVAFLDAYAGVHELRSRSAVVQAAIRALRQGDLREAYGDAWAEWSKGGHAAAWESVVSDGL